MDHYRRHRNLPDCRRGRYVPMSNTKNPTDKCPECSKDLIAVEYAYPHPEHYDGISEYACPDRHYRVGRWSNKILKEGEAEKRFGGE